MSDQNPLVGKKIKGALGAVVIDGPETSVSLWLGPGERFVVLMRNKTPIVIGHKNPGTYDIDGADFTEAGYPVMVLGINEEHLSNFQSLPFHVVNRILDKVKAAIDNETYTLEPMSFNYKTSDNKLCTFKFSGLTLDKPNKTPKPSVH